VTDKLSFWIVLAAAAVLAFALFAVGLGPATALAVVHVPAVLAALLFARATWRLLRARPRALRWRGRDVLAGPAGLWAPALFLVVWTLVRETGVVEAKLVASSAGHTLTTHRTAWREGTEPPLPSGIAVHAPPGALGDAFGGALVDAMFVNDQRLHARVVLACRPPLAVWPLYKSAAFAGTLTAELQLHGPAALPVRSSTLTMTLNGAWTMIGFASQRSFQQWVGESFGRMVQKELREHVRKALPN
jgi:hypothetical protein